MNRKILNCVLGTVLCLSSLASLQPIPVLGDVPAGADPDFVDLGTLGGLHTEALDINNHGQVVGWSEIANGVWHAFLWENGKMIDLGTMDGYFFMTVATDINDAGQVVGYGWHDYGSDIGFLWQDGVMTLDILGCDTSCRANDINNRGSFVGTGVTPGNVLKAILFQGGEMKTLFTLGGDDNYLEAINEKDWVAGSSELSNGRFHAAFWTENQMVDLGTLGGLDSRATGINQWGDVVGSSTTQFGSTHAFLWKGGNMQDLQSHSGDGIWGMAADINDKGQVIGIRQFAATEVQDSAFLWENYVFTNLGTFGGAWSRATAINDLGQVVGSSEDTENRERGFIWSRRNTYSLSLPVILH